MKKITINVAVGYTELDGQTIPLSEKDQKPKTLGQLIASRFAYANVQDKVLAKKYHIWSEELFANRAFEVDPGDYDTMLAFVEAHPGVPARLKALFMQAMEVCKFESEKTAQR